MENKTSKIKGEKAVNDIITEFYAEGKGKYCEICRMKGMKRRAYGERQIEGIDYFLCWDCCINSEFILKNEEGATKCHK